MSHALRWPLRLAVLAFLAAQLWAVVVVRELGDPELPPEVGNTPAALAAGKARALAARKAEGGPGADPDDGRYRFAILGDVQGTTMGWGMVDSMKKEGLDLLFLTGDVVRSGKPGYHQVLAHQFRQHAPYPFPVIYVMGNRDVKPGLFEFEDWEARYGPSNFSFSHEGDLFVVMRAADPYWPMEDAIHAMAAALDAQTRQHRHTFILTHVPPNVSEDLGGRTMLPQHSTWVRSVVEAYGVDYFLSAHHHGYVRRQVKDTVYLVSGGAGGGLHGPEAFHHGVVLEVGPEGVHERIIRAEQSDEDEVENALQGAVAGELVPRMRALWLPLLLLNLALVALALRPASARPSGLVQ